MLLISACLCGLECKYDGSSNPHQVFAEMLRAGRVIPICPEQLGGLATPREPAEISGGAGKEVLRGQARVLNKSGADVSAAFVRGAEQTLKIAQAVNPSLIILKSRSPSCGVGSVYDGSFSAKLQTGDGVTAALLKKHGFAVIDDEAYLQRESN
ncbi:MAG TPA: DUF523 domain-containing protein [Syntrophomonas sp.]|nr:DUF523 domain-containing protein [Syntrophomonas sp.]